MSKITPGLVFAVALAVVVLPVVAHPVAQGAMEIAVRADRIEIRARVSNEEAFVAEAFGGKSDARTTLSEAWQRHGGYLLRHLEVRADGFLLEGRLSVVTPPAQKTPEARIVYDLEFPLPAGRRNPSVLELQQNVLREFTFAPGNPWEASYVVRFCQPDGTSRDGLLFTSRQPLKLACNGNAPASKAAPALDRRAMAGAFIRHGIAHILGGYDHLLFVAGLVLAVRSLVDLVKVVTAFTVAHTLTLALAALDLVRVPSRVVEPVIAASIVFVALQNMLSPAHSRGWMRLAVAFGFGLFHGLGFAGGLLAAMEGMAGVAMFTAIAAFSFGVELGHQMVALPLFVVLKIGRSAAGKDAKPEWIFNGVSRLGSGAIAAAGVVYFVTALR